MSLLTPRALGPDAAITDLLTTGMVAATAGGDSFFMTGKEILVISNGSAGSITVTISSSLAGAKDDFGITSADHDLVITVAAGKTAVIGGLWVKRFADANGNAQVRYSAVASVTVGVVSVNSRN